MREPEPIETESLRRDTRAHRAGSAITAHYTFESFLKAVAPPRVRCTTCPGYADGPDHLKGCPRRPAISAAEARRGLAAAWCHTKTDELTPQEEN